MIVVAAAVVRVEVAVAARVVEVAVAAAVAVAVAVAVVVAIDEVPAATPVGNAMLPRAATTRLATRHQRVPLRVSRTRCEPALT